MSNTIPPHADRVAFDVVFKLVERPSKFLPGVMARVLTVECPSCQRKHSDFPATETLKCDCGLFMCCDYGATYIWRELAPATAE